MSENNNEVYKKFAQGIIIIRSEDSNFNSDFSGLPRRLPDEEGTIYATDKALKYCIRRYLKDKGEKIFVWRRYNENYKPLDIDENYKEVFGEELPTKKIKSKNNKNKEEIEKEKLLKKLLTTLDVRLFGVTYAGSANVSITGSTQITYGINKFPENIYYSSNILSPYKNIKGEEKEQQSIGNETKSREVHYVYDFQINPNNLISDTEFIKDKKEREGLLLKTSDVELLKESFCKSVTYVNSASKIGSENELLLFIEFKGSEMKETGMIESTIFPLMKNFVKIKKEDPETVIDLTKLASILKEFKKDIENIEIYYDPHRTKIEGLNELNITKKHIITLEEIQTS